MTTTNLNKTVGTTLLTTQAVQSNAVQVSDAAGMTGKFAATVYVRAGRFGTATALGSGNAPVFRIEANSNANGGWVPIYTWTTENHVFAPTLETITSNAAAGATAIQFTGAGSLGSALSTPIIIYNSATPANSEFNWIQGPGLTNRPAVRASLENAQTALVAVAITHAEMWAIPVDVSTFNQIRLVVDNIWNAVAQPYIVHAHVTTHDSMNNA